MPPLKPPTFLLFLPFHGEWIWCGRIGNEKVQSVTKLLHQQATNGFQWLYRPCNYEAVSCRILTSRHKFEKQSFKYWILCNESLNLARHHGTSMVVASKQYAHQTCRFVGNPAEKWLILIISIVYSQGCCLYTIEITSSPLFCKGASWRSLKQQKEQTSCTRKKVKRPWDFPGRNRWVQVYEQDWPTYWLYSS